VVDNIRSNATKKVLRLLADIAEKEPEKYAAFWKEFGAVLKEGLPEDFGTGTRSPGCCASPPPVGLGRAGRLAGRLREPDEGGPAAHLLPAGAGPGRGQGQPAPGGVQEEGHRGPAARRRRGHRQLGGGQPARVRRQAPAVGRPGQRRPVRAGGRGRSRGQEAGQRRARRAGGPAEGKPWGSGPTTSG
jgi:Molecular chaperone, HSP90 family